MEKYLERFLKRPDDLILMDQYLTREREKGVSRLKNARFSLLTASDLRGLMDFYFEQFINLMVTAGTLRKVDQALLRRFKKIWSGRSDLDERIAAAALPKKPAFAVLEERAALSLAAKLEQKKFARKSQEFRRELKNIHEAFAWSVLGYFDEKPKTMAQYEKEVEAALEKGAVKMLLQLKKRAIHEAKLQEKLKQELSKKDQPLMEIAAYASYLKDLFKSSENKLEYFAEPLFKELSKRSGYPVPFIKDLHPREILELIDGNRPDERKVAERVKHNVIIGSPDKLNILIGEEAETFEIKYFKQRGGEEKEWRGRIAAAGFAKGAARIVLSGKDFLKLRPGDILVVSNTSPDFVPIMRKAAAIVAEEGGLTAHVSVVSREFGIPCVVGIPHITEILKDGDLVEVDAKRGMVKILKRNNPL